MEKSKKWDLISLASIPLIMTLGNSMLIPVLPTMEKELDISALQSSMIITVYSLVAIVLIPIAGFLSDRIGRKAVIVPSLIITAIGGAISAWAAWKMDSAYSVILLGRVLQGVGAAGAAPIVMPLVGDMFKKESDVSAGLGLIETSNTFGKVLSPILGAFLASFLWFLPFATIPVFCLISILMVIILVKSPKVNGKPLAFKQFLGQVKDVFVNNGRWLYAIFLIGCILMFILFGVLFYLSTMLEEKHHLEGIRKGVILAVPLAALCFSSYVTGKTIKQNKILMKWLTFTSLFVLTVTAFATSYSEDIYILLTSLFISGLAIGLALPCLDALITEGIEKDERGTITSIYSSMRFLGVAAGPPIFASLMKGSHEMMFYVITAVGVIAVVLSLFSIKPDAEQS